MPNTLPPFTPTSIENRAAWDLIIAEPTKAAWIAAQAAQADALPPELRLPSAVDFLAARRSNDRKRLDDHWQITRNDFSRLALRRLTKGVDANDLDDRLLNWLFATTYEPTWVVSAHLPFDKDLPLSGAGQWDLAACEQACALAEFREAALPWMNANSRTIADSIVREIDRRVLAPVLVDDVHWAKPDALHLSNWAGVCAGSLLAACVSLEVQGFPRPECRAFMIRVLRRFFEVAFTPDGECDEGIGYWSYGVEFACLGLSRLSRDDLGNSFDLGRIRTVAGYPERCHLVGTTFYAGNDSSGHAVPPLGTIPWLAELADSDFLRWWCGRANGYAMRSLPTMLRYVARPTLDASALKPPTHAPNRLLRDQQVGIFQRPSKRGLFTFTLTGGTNVELHNHNDLGTFQLFLDERPIIPDPGCPIYTADFFTDARYTKYLVAASGGHCCPLVNGVEQHSHASARGVMRNWNAESGEISLDLTAAYPAAARLRRWVRTAYVATHERTGEPQAVMNDTFELDGAGEVVHRIWFTGEPILAGGGSSISVGEVGLTIEPKPASAAIVSMKASDERMMLRGYAADAMLHRVDLTYRIGNGPLDVKTTIGLA